MYIPDNIYIPNQTYKIILIISITIIPIIILFFLRIPAPYGIFYRKNISGPSLNKNIGWFIMESPGLFMFLVFYFAYGTHKFNFIPLFLLSLWMLHYINRSLIFPFYTMKENYKKMPLMLVFFGFLYIMMFSYLNAINISSNPKYTIKWMKNPVFIIGVIIFFIGFFINVWGDYKLQQYKDETKNSAKIELYESDEFNFNKLFNKNTYFTNNDKKDYQLPNNGLYNYVTSANYLGEIIEFIGWAVMTWSLPGLLFSIGSISCIGIRALYTHEWYKNNFKNFPKDRKALIPFII
jgi:steroid 5-alpha reductase family enzyme